MEKQIQTRYQKYRRELTIILVSVYNIWRMEEIVLIFKDTYRNMWSLRSRTHDHRGRGGGKEMGQTTGDS